MNKPLLRHDPLGGAPSREVYATLQRLSTADLAWLLGEILEPSLYGPFGRAYSDPDHEAFLDAVWPVTREYQKAFREIEAAVSGEWA